MNASYDGNRLAELDNDAADAAWAKIEADYRDEAISDVADKFNALAPSDFGEPTAYLTSDEEHEFRRALRNSNSEVIGHLYMMGLDRWREQYMTSDAAEKAIQARIYELAQENE